ncbi:alpha/beta hydrolase [Actinoplanes sp. NPDC023801]|uniref:alpha/beta hydrolase n=1 Tax=Actinoplanes sp. NPDC023801 TaxID=3154595 RepID=UPI00340ADECA
MAMTHVLMHSPSVGPATWAPIARRLPGSIVPSLLHVADAGPPFWPAVAQTVAEAINGLPDDAEVVLVAHSNAGLFVPAVVERVDRTIKALVFADAAVPARRGRTAVVSPENLRLLEGLVEADGRLPQWTRWFSDAEVDPMFPDPATRRIVEAEQPRLPLSYYQQEIPAAPGWDERPCGYLLFGPPYEQIARDCGWPVEHTPGRHLHQLVDPDTVTEAIRKLSHPA